MACVFLGLWSHREGRRKDQGSCTMAWAFLGLWSHREDRRKEQGSFVVSGYLEPQLRLEKGTGQLYTWHEPC